VSARARSIEAGEPGFEPGFTVLETVRIAVNSLPRGEASLRCEPRSSVRSHDEHMFVSLRRATADVEAARSLFGIGLSDYEIARRTGVSRSSVQHWRTRGIPCHIAKPSSDARPTWRPLDRKSYSYLLGIYLGDGYIANTGVGTPRLEISLDPKYPAILAMCSAAIENVAGIKPKTISKKSSKGQALRVVAANPSWLLAFPQHGPGKKHERSIRLVEWQKEIVEQFPQEFLRGLIHSDGSRVVNRCKATLASGTREYRYPRYFFTNLSDDIRDLFCITCDRLGIRWSRSSHKNISVANRSSVSILDSFVGPKA
jgi:hypothetical protein